MTGSAGIAGLPGWLNRDVTVSQCLTQDTGVQLEASKEILQPLDTVKATVKAAIEIFATVKEIAQKASNWLKGKGYKTNEEVKKDEEEAAAKKAEEERLRKEQEEAERKAAEEKKKEEERNSLTGSAKEVANIQEILDKINNGEPVSDSEYAAALKTLFKSLNQDGKELKTELKDTINNNKEIFRTLMKDAGFDVDNDAQVAKFAEKAQGGLCVQLTLFLQGVRNGFTEPASMGEYFKTAVENGLMNERIWQVKSTQEVFDTVYGKDAVQIIGCGEDTGAKSGTSFKDAKGNPTGLNPAEVLSNLNKTLMNSGATDITVRAKSTYSDYDHNMSIIKGSDGKYTLNDTKNRGTNIPVFDANGDFTDAFTNFIKPETIRSFYYLKKN